MNTIKSFDISAVCTDGGYDKLNEYINSMPIPDYWKKIIGNAGFRESNPTYYIQYPYLFLESMGDGDSIINSLCIAGYLYYQSIIYLDRILDKDIPIQQAFPVSNICDEEAVKLLSTLFPIDSAYWKLWYGRKIEYLKAYSNDFGECTSMSFDDFAEHADNKSALGKLAIDALFVLGRLPSNEYYEKCLLLHKYYYTAFQILDDILDVREDFAKGQFNIAHYFASKAVDEGKTGKEVLASGTEVVKYIHLSGISNELYAKADEYVSKAIFLSKELNLPYMHSESVRMNNAIVNQYLTVNGYIKTIQAECGEERYRLNRHDLRKAVADGILFVISKQAESGYWEEVCNNAGVSDVWATGFITSFLNEIESFEKKKEVINKAITFLLSNSKENGWGYNRFWIPDNDSTNFALLSIGKYYNTVCEEFEFVQNFDRTTGGVSTYYDRQTLICSLSNTSIIQDVDGWIQPHPCVSSVSFYLLSKDHFQGPEMESLYKYIISLLQSKSNLSYWWVDDIYSVYFIAKANTHLNDEQLATLIFVRIEKKVSDYREGKMEKSPFNLGLLLLALCTKNTIRSKYEVVSRSIAQELLAMQNNDGSWDASNAMCLPAANNSYPHNSREWNVASCGINVRATEYNRLYSSVVASAALAVYGINR